MQRMHEPHDYLCSPRGRLRDILEDSEIPRNESIVTNAVFPRCYTEKAPNARHRQGKQKTGDTYKQHKLFTFTFTFTNESAQLTDQAPGTIERAVT